MGGMRTATPQLARVINDRLALDLLLEHGPLTAPQLRELTGLSRPTVSDLIERLQANGLIAVTGEAGEDRRGPNARLYGLVADRAHVAGVDVRRDAVNVTVADITGRTAGSAARPLRAGDDLAGTVTGAVAEAAGPRAVHAVVLGAPGLFHPATGSLLTDNGVPGWRPDLPHVLGAGLGAPVTLENEVNLAAVAEHRAGAARDREDFVLLWLDDGVGAAVVLGGRLRHGASGGAGEIGWIKLSGTPFCDLVGAAAVRDLGRDALAARIAEGVLAAVAVLDPGLVVLGGRTGRSGGQDLAELVGGHLAVLSPAPTLVRASTVEGNAVLHGAVFTALSIAHRDVFGGLPG
ncbi:transcriptional regulator [Planomonospora parontospora subsp. parontospora]|uniref:Transcriptional regulator n=3 Tax=Planomonospora parontospora TaxID=58119 RepID=A0AA37BNL5_9ACTN|nr:transcriptional regulator [Planomonospora parontospora]GII12847.1 transcriptional regulator [Planomonospora parontospora subsp. parontospora]